MIVIGIVWLNVIFGLLEGISFSLFLERRIAVISTVGMATDFVFLGSVFVTDAV